ncbi:pleckstrin homology domain-containing family M member 2 isoform X1 [Pyrgilauda ruficollis]|uniref:pleckstrin homology domain-containing family M member 2 isoform X1 n=1 Tax=Pyrgilauda ruficollis TaxID=221976 RepID=UPI001B8683C1|nr:pleckstrin homology domain-containing family M member 2 isoform X1 [Pyrgilauda ruficollis]
MEPAEVKDRILENISLSVKKLQSYFAACEDETPAIRNHDKVLQRLCEHLDHALLYGLQDLSSGYWVLVVHFTRREAIKQIEVLQHVATNLGRSRAWLYLALNENSLESYLRLFQENLSLLHKYYVKNALVCSHDHLTLFLTLVSGLEFIRFDLDLDAPYLDLAPYMPDYYKPQHLLDFEERLPSSVHGSDSLSLNSFNSVTSTNLEWDDSAIAPSSEGACLYPESVGGTGDCRIRGQVFPFNQIPGFANIHESNITVSVGDYDFGDVFPAMQTMPSRDWEDGDLTDTLSCPRSAASEANGGRAAARSPTQRHNPFNQDRAEAPSSADTTPVHAASRDKAEATPEGTDQSESCTELEVIRLAKKKKTGKKKKVKPEETVNNPAPAAPEASGDSGINGLSDREEPPRDREGDREEPPRDGEGDREEPPRGGGSAAPGGPEEGGERAALGPLALRIPEMKDTSMESLGQPLSKVMDRLNGQLDPGGWSAALEPPGQPFRTGTPGETPDGSSSGDFSEGISAPMDFYRFTVESPNAAAPGGGHHDPPGPGQPPHVSGSPEAPEEEESKEGEAVGAVESERPSDEPQTSQTETTNPQALCEPKKEQPSPSPSSAEDSGVEEGQGSPSELTHPSEFRVDNNHLLLLMIHVFRENEEQLFRMIRMSTGHMEGNLQLIYVLLTDCYVYLIRKGAAEKPYMVEEAVSYNELDYISVGLDQQTVTLVCTNRRKQFLLDTADVALTEFFLVSLKSAMIKGCREPPYPSILTDATMEKLALAKFVAQESKCEACNVVVRFYGLVHWEDPMDEALGPASSSSSAEHAVTKDGILHYKAGTSYLGKEQWKPCFVVLSNGILYQYPDHTDVTPLLSINMGGEQCGGCRRSNTTDRPHSFQVILTDRPSLELSAENEEDMADWMQYFCQAVSKGVIPQGVAPTPCVPCCLVLTDEKAFTCHEDCQTSFFRSLGTAELTDITAVSTEAGKEYCILEFAQDSKEFLPPWVLYFSCTTELERFLSALNVAWRNIYQVDLQHKAILDAAVKKKCEDAQSLINSAWQRSDSLCRGRAERDPWC